MKLLQLSRRIVAIGSKEEAEAARAALARSEATGSRPEIQAMMFRGLPRARPGCPPPPARASPHEPLVAMRPVPWPGHARSSPLAVYSRIQASGRQFLLDDREHEADPDRNIVTGRRGRPRALPAAPSRATQHSRPRRFRFFAHDMILLSNRSKRRLRETSSAINREQRPWVG